MPFGVVRAAGLGLALAVTPLAGVQAVAQSPDTVASIAVVFNWFTKPKVAVKAQEAQKTVLVRFLGRGSYICSPAGSGQKSSCFKRQN